MTTSLYDTIGRAYARGRRADPRIVSGLVRALDLAPGGVVADVGAGTGNYSIALAERGYRVAAIEPSATMRGQATPHPRVDWHPGAAERMPLATASVDAAMAVLSFHHFRDPMAGLREMHRVAGDGPIVLFTCDLAGVEPFWLQRYFPSLRMFDPGVFPPLAAVMAGIERATGRRVSAEAFPLPHDLADGFGSAYWRRPEAYLDPEVRAGISAFEMAEPAEIEKGLAALRRDLDSGEWQMRHCALLARDTFDAGYHFVIARTK
jgi:ubiquinone/menaquinone biosynthesis C-methylase UbiE